jgi:hypothetical protein
LSEQYFTASQFLAQALRQTIIKPHCSQNLLGKLLLLPLNVACLCMQTMTAFAQCGSSKIEQYRFTRIYAACFIFIESAYV